MNKPIFGWICPNIENNIECGIINCDVNFCQKCGYKKPKNIRLPNNHKRIYKGKCLSITEYAKLFKISKSKAYYMIVTKKDNDWFFIDEE